MDVTDFRRLTMTKNDGGTMAWTLPDHVAEDIAVNNPDRFAVDLACACACDPDCCAPCHEVHHHPRERTHDPDYCVTYSAVRAKETADRG